ncbi:MAG: tRNA-intron lyase [Theionarchaea archaeon]|nr:tRNA-intron lyase [Theionarchaea archaeon]MBU7000203.1 tRNA-intron lyase [Theionarchaea archaeon]MBU7020920.1 tRNA-intron lyase [Theionarchaea archaeon]MBU7033972.1 tRNA-intron lyase [Theionarchaea archaeon]MBU7040532.1 tRNA-intron lyase [Theionarchaea archaeon]
MESQVVFESEPEVSKLHSKGFYGKIKEKKLYLNFLEALYLLEKGKIEVELEGELLDFSQLLEIARSEAEFDIRFFVYKDLRDRGLIVKTGFKYGCHFRVYRRGPEAHAEYLVHVIPEKREFQTYDIVKHCRLAHSVNKLMVFAFIDEEGDITYYSVERMRM